MFPRWSSFLSSRYSIFLYLSIYVSFTFIEIGLKILTSFERLWSRFKERSSLSIFHCFWDRLGNFKKLRDYDLVGNSILKEDCFFLSFIFFALKILTSFEIIILLVILFRTKIISLSLSLFHFSWDCFENFNKLKDNNLIGNSISKEDRLSLSLSLSLIFLEIALKILTNLKIIISLVILLRRKIVSLFLSFIFLKIMSLLIILFGRKISFSHSFRGRFENFNKLTLRL